jgi:hypothetical protein
VRESWSISLTATTTETTTITCRPVHSFSPALSLRLSPNPCSTPALDSLSVLYGHSDLFLYMITIFSFPFLFSFFFLICFCFLGDYFWWWPSHPSGLRGWSNHPLCHPSSFTFFFFLFNRGWSGHPLRPLGWPATPYGWIGHPSSFTFFVFVFFLKKKN